MYAGLLVRGQGRTVIYTWLIVRCGGRTVMYAGLLVGVRDPERYRRDGNGEVHVQVVS